LVGIDLPLVQAPIGRAATPRLVAAVSGAGGLGMMALSWTRPERVAGVVEQVRFLTDRPFGVNVILAWDQRARVEAALAAGVRVVSTFWGDPAPFASMCRQAGAVHVHTVGSAADARAAVDAGVNVVVAQGWEAGGHVLGQVASLPLVPAVVDAVDPVPVIAAGGVGDGRGLAAVLALGAAAAWVGTAFVVAEESGAHPSYQDAITTADETSTSYSVLFDGGWTDAPHRTLTTAQVRAWEEAGRPASGARPGEDDVVANEGTRAIRRYAADVPTAGIDGDIGSLPHYAGQSAGLVTTREPAAVIVERISTEAAATLQGAIAPQESGPAVQ